MKVYLLFEDGTRVHAVYATREGAREAAQELQEGIYGHRHDYYIEEREVVVK